MEARCLRSRAPARPAALARPVSGLGASGLAAATGRPRPGNISHETAHVFCASWALGQQRAAACHPWSSARRQTAPSRMQGSVWRSLTTFVLWRAPFAPEPRPRAQNFPDGAGFRLIARVAGRRGGSAPSGPRAGDGRRRGRCHVGRSPLTHPTRSPDPGPLRPHLRQRCQGHVPGEQVAGLYLPRAARHRVGADRQRQKRVRASGRARRRPRRRARRRSFLAFRGG